MLSIGSNLSAIDLLAQNNLNKAFGRLNQSSQRLSTMKRINAASDDPAGLIAVEDLRRELVSLEQADRNASRAASTIRVADSGLSQVSSLLNSVRGNILAAAGGNLSPTGRSCQSNRNRCGPRCNQSYRPDDTTRRAAAVGRLGRLSHDRSQCKPNQRSYGGLACRRRDDRRER